MKLKYIFTPRKPLIELIKTKVDLNDYSYSLGTIQDRDGFLWNPILLRKTYLSHYNGAVKIYRTTECIEKWQLTKENAPSSEIPAQDAVINMKGITLVFNYGLWIEPDIEYSVFANDLTFYFEVNEGWIGVLDTRHHP